MFKKIEFIRTPLVVLFFLALPYYLFNGKMFIGGDDTRLFYYFPWEYIRNSAFFSWANVASVGFNNPNQHQLPFLFLLGVLYNILHNRIVVGYLAFSIPQIIGFIFFEKLINELIDNKYKFVAFIGGLFYTLSPIVQINQLSYFLTAAYLIGLFPLVSYYFTRYLKTASFSYIFKTILWGIPFAIALYQIPWLLGLAIPLGLGLLIGILLYRKSEIKNFLKCSITFFSIYILSQSFWIIPFFIMFFVKNGNSFATQISSISGSFASTVAGSASGSIIFPLLNLFHRQLIMDFTWQAQAVFLNFYDRIFYLNTIFFTVILLALFSYKKNSKTKLFIVFLSSFIFSLYFFTVNIGPLKDIFLFLRYFPFSVVFRNFYDKFALGYVFLYAIALSLSLASINENYKNLKKWVSLLVVVAIFINTIPIKDIVNKKLWTTKNTYTNISISEEYFKFMLDLRKTVDPTSYILSLPFNIAGYTIIKDQTSNAVYAGTSPLKIFTGVNDIAGNYSFPGSWYGEEIQEWWTAIFKSDYETIREKMRKFHMNYVFLTKNVPQEVKKSYLFDGGDKLKTQDQKFIDAITDQKILVSQNGNYELYTARDKSLLIKSENVYFQKLSPVKYLVYFENSKDSKNLSFFESFNPGWKLYRTIRKPDCVTSKRFVATEDKAYECAYKEELFSPIELSYLFEKPLFDNSHRNLDKGFNKWTINAEANSKDLPLVLYFQPQIYFYWGSVVSALSILAVLIYYIYSKRKNE